VAYFCTNKIVAFTFQYKISSHCSFFCIKLWLLQYIPINIYCILRYISINIYCILLWISLIHFFSRNFVVVHPTTIKVIISRWQGEGERGLLDLLWLKQILGFCHTWVFLFYCSCHTEFNWKGFGRDGVQTFIVKLILILLLLLESEVPWKMSVRSLWLTSL
jgi:hypothetical protein